MYNGVRYPYARERLHPSIASGSVISQTPTSGTQVDPNSEVNLIVSTGPCPANTVAVPLVTNKTQAEAQTAITAAGLTVGTITQQCSNQAAGTVLSQNPSSGTEVALGSAVNLVVSSGTCLKVVPRVIGMTQAEAEAALTGEGLVLGTVETAYSETTEAGRVISQNPVNGTEVVAGTAVSIIVSLGTLGQRVSLMGWVKDPADNPLGGVTVTVDGVEVATTGGDGSYAVYGLAPKVGAVVAFTLSGYTSDSVLANFTNTTTTTVNAVLFALKPPQTAQADQDIDVLDEGGNRIQIPAGALVSKDKRKAKGEVEIQITPLDVTNPAELAAFPGNFTTLTSNKNEGFRQLETFGLADYRVTQDGEELQLAPGTSAFIEIALAEGIKKDGKALQPGDLVPLWYFDETLGHWQEEGVGEVIMSKKSGQLVYRAKITHFSWWNCDVAIQDWNWLKGCVESLDGKRIPGVQVIAAGVDHMAEYHAIHNYGEDNGEFCLYAKRGSTILLKVMLPGMQYPLIYGQVSLDRTNFYNCNEPYVQTVCPIVIDYNGCVSGYVRYEDGTPIADIPVSTNYGESSVTDESGYYCMPTYYGTWTEVRVVGRQSAGVFVGNTGNCETGGCAELNFSLQRPPQGQLMGLVMGGVDSFCSWPCCINNALEGQAVFSRVGDPSAGMDFNWITTAIWGYSRASEMYMAPWINAGMVDMLRAWDPGSPATLLVNNAASGNLMQSLNRPALFNLDGCPQAVSGDAVSWSFPGGFDIGAFQTADVLPEPLALTSPYSVDFVSDVDVQWAPSEMPSDFVLIEFIPIYYEGKDDSGEKYSSDVQGMYRLWGVVPDTGSCTITKEQLSNMPVADDYILIASRVNAELVSVPLATGYQGTVWSLWRGPCNVHYLWRSVTWPVVQFTTNPRSGPAPLTVQFTNTTVPGDFAITSWRWSFGDGATSTEEHPQHTFTVPGWYWIYMEAYDAFNRRVGIYGMYVEVFDPTSVYVRGDITPTSGFAPLSVQCTDRSYAPPATPIVGWHWDFGDGATSDEQHPSHMYETPGWYSVFLTITLSDTTSYTEYIQGVYVEDPDPQVWIGGWPQYGLAPLNVWFWGGAWDPMGQGIASWFWDFGDGATSSEQYPAHTFTGTGVYDVSLTVTTVAGYSSTANMLISVWEECAPVDIPDAALSQVIRWHLDVPENEMLCQGHLAILKWLDAGWYGITDLTGLEYAYNLEELYLYGNQITDVSPLANLSSLRALDLWSNQISTVESFVSGTIFSGASGSPYLDLRDNPLLPAVCETQIPALESRGVSVYHWGCWDGDPAPLK